MSSRRQEFPAPSDAEQAALIMLADLSERHRHFLIQYGPRMEAARETLIPLLKEWRELINSQIAVLEILLLLRQGAASSQEEGEEFTARRDTKIC